MHFWGRSAKCRIGGGHLLFQRCCQIRAQAAVAVAVARNRQVWSRNAQKPGTWLIQAARHSCCWHTSLVNTGTSFWSTTPNQQHGLAGNYYCYKWRTCVLVSPYHVFRFNLFNTRFYSQYESSLAILMNAVNHFIVLVQYIINTVHALFLYNLFVSIFAMPWNVVRLHEAFVPHVMVNQDTTCMRDREWQLVRQDMVWANGQQINHKSA